MGTVEVGAGISWREQEPSLEDVIKKYPGISPLVILKTDIQRRGLGLTQAALGAVDPARDATHYRGLAAENQGAVPNGLLLRDGTTTISNIFPLGDKQYAPHEREPYTIDLIKGKPTLTDQGRIVDEVSFWPKPDFADKVTSKGTPMWQLLIARPQRMDINLYQNCDMWKEAGMCCKFCFAGFVYRQNKDQKAEFLDFDDVAEAVAEAVKEPGRFRSIQMCSGTLLGGDEVLDAEVDAYAAMLDRIAPLFEGKTVMTQMVATAFNERQLLRLRDETILTSYTSDIEVLDEEIFNWICPGKAKYIGYKGWKERLYRAAEIFGPGRVTSGIVSGVELAQPKGFTTEEEALEKCLSEAEDLASHGVGIGQTVFHVEQGSPFAKQKTATLDYLIAFAQGLDTISQKHNLSFYFDDYRTCGNHPNTDLARTWHGRN